MACSRGKASPDDHTRLRLFADSGGYCQKTDCTRELFIDLNDGGIHIAEVAHIVAAGNSGPRANAELSPQQRGNYSNLLLLCPSCHSEIDKAPNTYPDDLVASWKRRHKDQLRRIFGTVVYQSRPGLRAAVEPILTANKSIFDQYNPNLEYSLNPESEEAQAWKRKVITSILPNNRRLLEVLDANRNLLTGKELSLLEEFRQHFDDIAARHLAAKFIGGGKKFPHGMSSIVECEAP